MTIGLCGTGKMGAAMVLRLLDCGQKVMVWNRDGAKCAPLVAAGAVQAATPAELAGACDSIITILLNDDAVNTVFRGTDGILSAPLGGRVVIEMSTLRPATIEALAGDVHGAGGRFVECPVGGSVQPAREGKLLGLVGGSDEDVATARPLLEMMCRRVEHVGPNGAGSRMKLAVNLPLMVYWRALGEALALVRPLGLDPARLMDIMTDTSGAPAGLRGRAGAIAAGLGGAAPTASAFDVSAAYKDLVTMVETGRAMGQDMSVSAAALDAFREAMESGLAAADASRLAVLTARGAA